MIEEKADPMSPNGANTGFRNGGTYTYLKLFYAPEDWEQKTVLVYFEGIYRNALVYLNGQMVARNPQWVYRILCGSRKIFAPRAE